MTENKIDIICESYSEKAIVVRGQDTKLYKEELKDIGGKYNSALKGGPGWIFSKSALEKIKKLVSEIKKKPKKEMPTTQLYNDNEIQKLESKIYILNQTVLTLSTELDRIKAILENQGLVKGEKEKGDKKDKGEKENGDKKFSNNYNDCDGNDSDTELNSKRLL